MARAPDVIVDDSPLDAHRIDVPLRVGWLLRTCRLNSAETSRLPGHRFAAEVGVGPAMVTKWEKGSDPIDARDVASYERLVGLPAGSLRGLIETTRRTFRHPVSPTVAAEPLPTDLEAVSELVWPAIHGRPTGEDWLHLADALALDGPLRVPTYTARPILDRLASELCRSVGGAFLSRYEAMSRLRSGPYADVALPALLDAALADDAQLPFDLLRVSAHLPTAELFVDMVRLLNDDRDQVFAGAAHALATMASQGGITKADMRDAVPCIVEAYNGLADNDHRHVLASDLMRNLPPGVLETARSELARPLAPLHPFSRVVSKDSELYRLVQRLADDIRAELTYPTDQVLDRLLFEALFERRWTHSTTAISFLKVVPYREQVALHVTRFADRATSEEVHRAAVRFVARFGDDGARQPIDRWLTEGTDAQVAAAMANVGVWGDDLDEAVLNKVVVQPTDRLGMSAVFAAGMTGNPLLLEWAEDPSSSQRVRSAARWWLRNGPRVEV